MILIAIRETAVVLLGCLVAHLAWLLAGNANRDFSALVVAILVPIAFCLLRASLVKRPDSHLSPFRRIGYQLGVGLAFVLLLLFEMGFAMFLGAADIPRLAWLIITSFAVGYVILYCVAHRVGFIHELVTS